MGYNGASIGKYLLNIQRQAVQEQQRLLDGLTEMKDLRRFEPSVNTGRRDEAIQKTRIFQHHQCQNLKSRSCNVFRMRYLI